MFASNIFKMISVWKKFMIEKNRKPYWFVRICKKVKDNYTLEIANA